MRIIRPEVSRAAIDAEIRAATYPGHSPARWALPLLDELEPLVLGWQLVELDESALAAAWLPAHYGEACHGDVMRLGDAAAGSSVRDAHGWLEIHGQDYAAANPSCWGRLTHASRSAPSPIVVSTLGAGDRIKPAEVALVVIDGFHRALACWRAGHRSCLAYLPRIAGGL